MIVRQLLEAKGYDVWAVRPDDTIYKALQIMAEKNIGAVLVMENNELMGIFSERDYARKVVLEGKSSRETPVSEGMTARVVVVTPERRVETCMALMTDNRIRHLPVVQNNDVVGVVSIGDIVKAVISKQEHLIEQLENYITSGSYGG